MASRYVLITAAKDEEGYIGRAIELTLRQSTLPLAWIIVDDGSNDRTVEVVEKYSAEHHFIQLHSSKSRGGRNFGSQYKAVQAGFELVEHLEFDFIGVQDADLGPADENYYAELVREFDKNSRLGMASGFVFEFSNDQWKSRPGNSSDSTTGSAMFRRRCYEQIGGYSPLMYGGSDTLAQIDAKMLGWEILVRPDLRIFHYRPTSSEGGVWRGRYREGLMDASLGYHPVFELFKCFRRLRNRPFLLGSIVRFMGFISWKIAKKGPLIPPEKVAFLRAEQKRKMQKYFKGIFARRRFSHFFR